VAYDPARSLTNRAPLLPESPEFAALPPMLATGYLAAVASADYPDEVLLLGQHDPRRLIEPLPRGSQTDSSVFVPHQRHRVALFQTAGPGGVPPPVLVRRRRTAGECDWADGTGSVAMAPSFSRGVTPFCRG